MPQAQPTQPALPTIPPMAAGGAPQSNQDAQFAALLQKYNYTPPAPAATTGGWYSKLNPTTAAAPVASDESEEEPAAAPKPTLGDEDMQQLQQAGQKIVDSVNTAGQKLGTDANGTPLGEAKGLGDVLEGLLGAGSGVVQGISAPVSAVFEKLLSMDPAAAKEGTVDPADPQGKLLAAAQQFKAAHPELSQNISDAVNVAGAFGGAEGLIPGGDLSLGDFASTGKGMLEDAAGRIKAATAPAEGVAEAAPTAGIGEKAPVEAGESKTGNIAKSAAAHAIGVQPTTVDMIYKNPDLFSDEKMSAASRQANAEYVQKGVNRKVAQLEMTKEGAGVSPRALGDQINSALAKRETQLENNAKDYGAITGERTPGATDGPQIKVAKNFLDKQVEKATGRVVKNGKIDPTPSSAAAIREPKDIRAAQTFLDTHRPAFQRGSLSGNEFLNVRDDLTKLSNFDSGGSPSLPLEKMGKAIRANLNDTYRGRFPGLEKADATYEKNVTDLNRLKTGLIDHNGDLSENAITRILSTGGEKYGVGDKLEELAPGIKKQVQQLKDIENEQERLRTGIVDKGGHLLDGAANKIHNASGVGKDLLSNRLEEVAPGINDRVQYLKAVEDIKGARGIKTGSYIKAGLTLLNGPFGVASFVLTHPDVAVPILRKLGANAQEAAKIAGDLGVAAKK